MLTHEYVGRMLNMAAWGVSRVERICDHAVSMKGSVEELPSRMQVPADPSEALVAGARYVLDSLLASADLGELERGKEAVEAWRAMESYTSHAAARMRRYRLRKKQGIAQRRPLYRAPKAPPVPSTPTPSAPAKPSPALREPLTGRHLEIARALGGFDETPWVPPAPDADIFGE
jgi:hypothetical protein